MEQNTEKVYKYKVCTRCITYNHAPYIEDAMNGFTMQETTFPVITLIIDDASTDGEPEVIRQYLSENFQEPYRTEETDDYNLICANHKTNENCIFVVFLLKYNHYSIKKPKMPYLSEWLDNSKYHALCEGDDYWTCSQKLQKQVDFLDRHPDFSLCFHNAIIDRKEQGKDNTVFAELQTREYTPYEITVRWTTPTASVLMTTECQTLYTKLARSKKIVYGDSFLRSCCISIGRIYGFAETMSVYRKHPGGMVFNSSFEQRKRFCNQINYEISVFPEQKKALTDSLSNVYFDLSVNSVSKKHYINAVKCFFQSLFSSPAIFFKNIIKYIKNSHWI